MSVRAGWRPSFAAAACAVLACACAAPKPLYQGPALPREKVALLRSMPFTSMREGTRGRGNTVGASGQVVIIGLDGKVFNKSAHAAYSGRDFSLAPGRHSLLAYCEYTAFDPDSLKVYYSELFTVVFTARAGREYRYEARFRVGVANKDRVKPWTGIVAEPGVWDVTENRGTESSNRVDEGRLRAPVAHKTLTHIQAAVD